jgi:hypothetical protein
MRVKKGFFTNGCKKATKHVQIVHKIIHKKEALEEGLLDIFVKSVEHLLAQKEDQSNYKKLSSKSTF